jgi:predicted nucleotidyltransferase
VAGLIKADDPARLVVFGGPSARPVMFARLPFLAADDIDVLVISEGEETFLELVTLEHCTPSALRAALSSATARPRGATARRS